MEFSSWCCVELRQFLLNKIFGVGDIFVVSNEAQQTIGNDVRDRVAAKGVLGNGIWKFMLGDEGRVLDTSNGCIDLAQDMDHASASCYYLKILNDLGRLMNWRQIRRARQCGQACLSSRCGSKVKWVSKQSAICHECYIKDPWSS
ncbi:hypothetical protein HPP92_018367 [Vanilla planifolia]|uniref:Uncharacterized protein n=1 Tax=Vanilla planifolia TaxID=51239 RepID=A0A835QCP0_VANPL|nr:hypothetical protein HPP92_018367 [Vanilla planifolia]